MTGTALTKIQQAKSVLLSRDFAQQVEETLPPGLALDRFMRTAKSVVQANPDLLNHDHKSLWASIIACARDGLLPDGREAALAVYGGKVQYLPMIGGLRKRAAEFGIRIDTYVVYEHDDFGYGYGLEPWVRHAPVGLGKERGNAIGVYAVGTDLRGRKYLEVMSRSDVERVRKSSRARGGPWEQWWEEMARKTVGRRLFKSLPLYDESVSRLLESVDAEFKSPEEQVSRDLGWVGPPADGDVPDDSLDETDDGVIEGHAVLVEDSAGEPEDAPASEAGPLPVAQADVLADVEPASPAENDSAQTSFEEMAERAQKARAGKHKDPTS